MWHSIPGPIRTALKYRTGPGLVVQGVKHFFADGGHVATRTTAVVGERGPEIVSLPAGARVHPNEGGGSGGSHDAADRPDGRRPDAARRRVQSRAQHEGEAVAWPSDLQGDDGGSDPKITIETAGTPT